MTEEIEKNIEKIEQLLRKNELKENQMRCAALNKLHEDERKRKDIAQLEKINKEHIINSGGKHQTTVYAELARMAKDTADPNRTGYYDYPSTMLQLVALYDKLVLAGSIFLKQQTAPITLSIKQFVRDNLLYPLKDYLLHLLEKSSNIEIPTVMHSISFKKNRLQINDLRPQASKLDSQDIQELNQSICNSVCSWLVDSGFRYDNRTGLTSRELSSGCTEILTEELFENLKRHPQNGLNKFLNEKAEGSALHFEEESTLPSFSMC